MTTSVEPGSERNDFTAFAMAAMTVALRYRMLMAATGLLFFGAMVGPRIVGRRSYSAEASFVPQDRQQLGGGALASLAAQFGVAVPSGSTSESPSFYAALVTTRAILNQVVLTRYDVTIGDVNGGTLIDLWDVPGSSPGAQLENATQLLRESMVVNIARETGAVTVRVTSGNPRLASLLVERILGLVNDFNVNRRQSQATAERKFVAVRLEQAGKELAAAESALNDFLTNNRQSTLPPRLQFEADRLQRNVTLQQQLYTSLAQGYEQARINEARNTAVITVIERPDIPVSPNRRRLVITAVESLILAFVASMLVAFTLEVFRNAKARDDDELRTLAQLWRETRDDLRHPILALLRTRTELLRKQG